MPQEVRVLTPAHGVLLDARSLGLFENRIGLVAGAKVEDAALPHRPHAAAVEVLAFVPLLLEDDGLRRGDVEALGSSEERRSRYYPINNGFMWRS